MASRSGWLCCLAFASLMLSMEGAAQTATTNPEDEYKKLVKVDTEIQPLGENPFGESVNVYDGSLSFHVVDISIPGNGPTIQISRTFHADGDASVRWNNAQFGDWELELPRLTTLVSNQSTIIAGPDQIGWLVNTIARTDRCTNFREPPDQRIGRPGTEPVAADSWWNEGYTLHIPEVPDQDMLVRTAASPAAPTVLGLNYTALSKDLWHLGCLASTANGEPGEAFVAVGPNGSKYWLNQLLYRPSRSFGIIRKQGLMFATREEDRFGNWVAYTYNGAQITSIDSSDDRHVTFEYAADGIHVSRINVVSATSGTRSWNYAYTAVSGGSVLSSVTLPDGSAWSYALQNLTYDVKSPSPPGHCLDTSLPDELAVQVGTITAPSGLQGQFEARPTRHGRSDVPELCNAQGGGPTSQGTEASPRYTNNLALRAKTFTGAGIGTQSWAYSYPVATASWHSECVSTGACVYTTYSTVLDPSGNTTRYTFSNRADATEGKPLKTEYFFGGAAGTPVRKEEFTYAYASADVAWPWPWPQNYGAGFNVYANRMRQQQAVPQLTKTVTQDGTIYRWGANQFDGYARAANTNRFANTSASINETHTYLDDPARSVIGLPLQETNVTAGEVVSTNSYNPDTLTLTSRQRFGQQVMAYTFNAAGQLASFTDGNQNTTTLGAYKRGIPQTIMFPDKTPDHPGGTVESIAVDDFGQVTSVTDQAGATTSYGYDAMGRVSRIDYPAGDAVAWAPRLLTYTFGGDARGLGGNHWVRSVTQGSRSERTDFDVMLRPVMTGKSEAGTGALYVSSRLEYDWKGHKTFESYPVDGASDRAGITLGVTTTYDAIGRETSRTSSAELAGVTTRTAYLSGPLRQVTDPVGNIVQTYYQAFDEPAYDTPLSVSANPALAGSGGVQTSSMPAIAPVGRAAGVSSPDDSGAPITQTITRDSYGNPLLIAQGSVSRKLIYDAQHRLCRTIDPETNSEVTAYDAAGNVIWTASGQPIATTDGCAYDQVAATARVSRAYDGMNRVAAVNYPNGTLGLTFTYDPLGNIATAVSSTGGGNANNRGTVGWSFGRNKLGLLTAEVLSVDAYSWGLGYDYNANGALNATLYPDGKLVSYAPNALGQPTSVGTYAVNAAYYPDGQAKLYALGNGANFSASLNTRNLLSNLTFSAPGGVAVGESFGYDKNGNMTSLADQVGSGQRSRTFAYDGINRLSSATAGGLWGTESYTYDSVNNIRTMVNGGGTSTYSYDAGTNLLQSISGAAAHTFQYDAQGNVVNRDGQVMNFDPANRLLSVAGKGDYMYDAAGRRVKNVAPGVRTYYAYNSDGLLMWQFDPATNAGTDYVYLGKKLVASTINVLIPSSAPVLTVPASVQANVAYSVSWTSVPSSTSYDLQEQVDGGAWATIGSGATTSRSITHPAASTYHYQVRACNAGGCGAYSGPATTIVTPPPSAPAAPASVAGALAANQQSFTVSWSASGGATSYGLQVMVGGGAWTDAYTGAATSASVGAVNDGTYRFQARACNANGCSTWTHSADVGVLHTPPAPASISVPGTSSGSLGISWSVAAYANLYVLQQSADNVNYGNVWSGPATSTTISVGASGVYHYRVVACNGAACGPAGPVAGTTVTLPPSQAPTISVPATSSNGCYTVNWGGVGPMSSYVMQEQVNGGGWTTVGNDGSGALNICGKGAGNYGYRVQGCNAGGCGPFSATATVTVSLVPPVPGGIRMEDTIVGKSQRYTMYWDATPGATRYEIFAVQLNKVVFTVTGTSQRVEAGVEPYNLLYTYRLRACNDQGCSAWSGDITG